MSPAPIEGLFRHRVFGMLRRKGLLSPERIKLMESWVHSGFNVNAQVRIGADEAPHAKVARASWARFIKKVFAADPLECPDCGGTIRIVAFIEEPRVVRAILEHLSLWDEPRPPPGTPAARHAPTELEYLHWVD